ncbi:hypothetical protein Tco_1484652 [Tanacetum coccineum]
MIYEFIGKFDIQRYIRWETKWEAYTGNPFIMGPTPHPMVTDPPPTSSTIVPHEEKSLILSSMTKKTSSKWLDTQVKSFLVQGLPRTLHLPRINRTSTASGDYGNIVNYLCIADREELYNNGRTWISPTTPYVQIYTHLKASEPHAQKDSQKQEQVLKYC